MGRQILELSEDAELVERLKKLAREHGLESAWIRVIGTVKNAVFLKADGGDTFVPGVLQLVHGDVVITTVKGALHVQASVTVTKDGKSTICGMLKSARIVSVFVHLDSPSFADAAVVGAAGRSEVARAEDSSSGWRGVQDSVSADDAPRAESILDTEDEDALLERLTRRSHTVAPAQEELAIDGADEEADEASEHEAAGSGDANPWGAVARASDEAAGADNDQGPKSTPSSPSDSSDEDSGSNPWAMVAETSDEVKKSSATTSGSGKSRAASATRASGSPKSRADKLKAFAESVENFIDVDELNRGDILEHPILGECRVLRVVNDDSAQVQINRGASRKLMLKIFNIIRTGDGYYRLEKKG